MVNKISIIIVTYNSQSHITDCMDSIVQFIDVDPNQLEIIFVDNSAGTDADETKKLVENHPLTGSVRVLYIHNPANLGYGQGNNVGIRSSTGDIICIMNPDVRFCSKVLADALRKFQNRNLALLGYKQLGGYNLSYYLKPEFKNVFAGVITKLANRFNIFLQKYFYLSGAFFFIDRKKVESIGLFDEKIFLYFEEPDLARRIAALRYDICYDKSIDYLHLVGERAEWSERAFTHEINSLKYYLEKFNLNSHRIIRNYLREYQLKIGIAKFIGDEMKLKKFTNEYMLVKNIFGPIQSKK